MSWTRFAGALLVALALMTPASQAALLLDVEQPDALAPWGLTQESMYSYGPGGSANAAGSADFALGIARDALVLDAAGDLNADGHADVLLQVLDLNGGFADIQAVSGAELSSQLGSGLDATSVAEGYADGSILWTLNPSAGSLVMPVGDVDGDFVADFVVAQSAGADVAGSGNIAGTADGYSGANVFQLMSGADIAGQFGVELADSVQNTAGSSSSQADFGFVMATGADSVHQVETTVTTSSDAAITGNIDQLSGASLFSTTDTDATIAVLDSTGELQGTISFVTEGETGASLLPTQVEAPDTDLDGHADTAVVLLSQAGADGTAGYTAQVQAFLDSSLSASGTNSADWVFQFDADGSGDFDAYADRFAGEALIIPDIGDVNADGHADMAFHALLEAGNGANTRPQTTGGATELESALVIVSGADGSELASQTTAAGSLLFASPLGSDIDGDAAAEILVLSGADLESIDTVSVASTASGNLETIWSVDIPDGSVPVNLVSDAYTGASAGLTDLNADGVVDLAIASTATYEVDAATGMVSSATGELDATHIEVFDGVDGSLLYTLDLSSQTDAANAANVDFSSAADAAAQADGNADAASSASADAEAQAAAAADAADSTALAIEMIDTLSTEAERRLNTVQAEAEGQADDAADSTADAEGEANAAIDSATDADAAADAQAHATGRIATVEAVNAEAVGNGFVHADELALRLSQASDGAAIFRVPLLDEETIAELGPQTAFTANVVGQGDVNADGYADVLVRVEGILTDAASTDASEIQGQLVAHTESAFDQVYVIDGQTGATLDSQLSISSEANGQISGDPDSDGEIGLDSPMSAGSVQKLEAYGSEEGGYDAPGLGMLPIVALLGAVVVALRRRK